MSDRARRWLAWSGVILAVAAGCYSLLELHLLVTGSFEPTGARIVGLLLRVGLVVLLAMQSRAYFRARAGDRGGQT